MEVINYDKDVKPHVQLFCFCHANSSALYLIGRA